LSKTLLGVTVLGFTSRTQAMDVLQRVAEFLWQDKCLSGGTAGVEESSTMTNTRWMT
jgi:hypothetical protein